MAKRKNSQVINSDDHAYAISSNLPSKDKEKFASWIAIFIIVINVFAMLFMEEIPDHLESAFMLALGFFFGQANR